MAIAITEVDKTFIAAELLKEVEQLWLDGSISPDQLIGQLEPLTNDANSSISGRRHPALYRFGLTAKEMEVAQLVLLGGFSRKEAAQAMWLEPQTIKFHLRNIYRKLEVSTRADAAARLAS